MQTTYENFRALYQRQANPYDKGVMGNFKEVFLSSVSPSKNKFRAKVRKELDFPSRRLIGSFINPDTGKATVDVEMGMKPAWVEFGRVMDRQVVQLSDGDGMKEGSVLAPADDRGEQTNDTDTMEEPELEALSDRGSNGDSRSESQP